MEYLDIIADDKGLVTYRPKLNGLTKSVCGTILLQQILHLWKNNKRKAFYKFFEPCQHPFYKEGDSWAEALGMTWHEIHSALDKFGVKVKPGADKSAYLQTHIILYWTDRNRLTWFEVNEPLLQAKLAELYAPPPNLKSVITKSEKVELPNLTISVPLVSEITETTEKEAQAPTVAELWNAIPSASNAEITDNGLIPLTQEERHLFSALNVERAAKHHTPLTRFKTTKQREKFRGCVAIFNGSTCIQIDELIANGKGDIESVVNALDWRRRNNAPPPDEHPPAKDTPAVDMSMVILR